MSDWARVGENLVRHKGGKIYLRACVAGKIKRVSLKTDNLRIAKLKRDDLLDAMRKAAAPTSKAVKIKALGEALAVVIDRDTKRPHLRERSSDYYSELGKVLAETLPVSVQARSWTAGEASAWWRAIAKRFSGQRANNLLAMAKRVGALLVDQGLRIDDPTSSLRRVRVRRRELNAPARETIDAIMADMRGQRKAFSDQAADFVGFLAFSGCRSSQARAARWNDVSDEWIEFRGGIKGAKGAETRRLPINGPLRDILDRLRSRAGEMSGPIFGMSRPHESLTNACKRLKIPHLRIHDLRHFFASWAIESGIDVPTVSRWLGHKDGGALVMRTYSHLRDDHSAESAKRLS